MAFQLPEEAMQGTKSTGFSLPKEATTFTLPSEATGKSSNARSQRRGGASSGSSWVDDFLFTGRLGISDTYRGISQIAGEKGYDVAGLADVDKMREDEERLNQILQDNPWAGWTGYIGGLFMDPAGWLPWTAPARRLQQINAIRKLYEKTDKASKAKKLAIEATAAGTAGAGVGALGYLDEDAVNPITGERLSRLDMALMGGAGSAVLGPAFQAASKKWDKPIGYKFNPGSKKPIKKKMNAGRVWDFASRPGNTGAAYGGALGGYGGWQSTEELDMAGRLAALGLGTLAGGAGGKYAINKIGPEKFMPGFNQTKAYIESKYRKAGETSKIYKDEIQPTLEKITKLTPEENRALYRSVTEKDPALKASHLEAVPGISVERIQTLDDLGREMRDAVDKLAKELVDLGVLDSKIQAKNADSYLHRIFDKPDAAWKEFKKGGLRMIADELNARGKVETVSDKKWREMQADMENPNTAGGIGRTNVDAGGKWLDEQGNLVRKDDPLEWEEWDPLPKNKAAHDKAVAEYEKSMVSWRDKRERWLNRSLSRGPKVGPRKTNKEILDEEIARRLQKRRIKKANKNAYLGDATPDEIELTKLNDKEVSEVINAAEKSVGIPETYRSSKKPKEPTPMEVRIRRDWTPEERKVMGEVESAYDAFAATGKLLSNDVAAARFLNRASRDPQIARKEPTTGVRMGDDGVPVNLDQHLPNDKKKYGDLAGMYVSKETAFDLGKMNGDTMLSKAKATKLGQYYSRANALWKGTKTILNPNVHMNNFASNVMHYDHGVTNMGAKKWLWLGKSMKAMSVGTMKEVKIGGKTILRPDFGAKGTVKIGGETMKVQDLLDDAERAGVFGGGFMDAELGQVEVAKLMKGDASALESGDPFKALTAATNIADRAWKMSKRGAKKWLWDKPGKVYQYEDNVFRFALYMAEVDKLMTAGISMRRARGIAARKGKDWFVNYEDVPEALAWMRELPVPFLSYMYGIIPKIAETAVKQPMKIAKWSGALALADEAGWQNSDVSYEERKQIEHLMSQQQGGSNSRWGIPGMGPKNIKIGDDFNPFSEQGDMGFLDLSRAYTGGNIFGAREGDAGSLKFLPEWLQPTFGAAGGLVAPLMGYDLFKGENIPMMSDRLRAMFRQFTPNLPLGEMISAIPGMPDDLSPFEQETWAGNKIQRARSGNYSDTKDVHTLPTAWAALFGIKLRPVTEDKLEQRIYRKHNKIIRAYDKKISQLGSELDAGGISEETYERRVQKEIDRQERAIINLEKALDYQYQE